MFELGHEIQNGVLILSPAKRIDSTTAQAFEEGVLALVTKLGNKVILDLSDLDYISSAGLRVILTTAKHVKSSGGNLTLCGLEGGVKQVMEASGFDSVFGVHSSIDDALAAFAVR